MADYLGVPLPQMLIWIVGLVSLIYVAKYLWAARHTEKDKDKQCSVCGEVKTLGMGMKSDKLCLMCFTKTRPIWNAGYKQGRKELQEEIDKKEKEEIENGKRDNSHSV